MSFFALPTGDLPLIHFVHHFRAKEIQQQPEKLFEMIRMDVLETVGQSLSHLMDIELTHFLGRKHYERTGQGDPNHRNGSYDRNFTLRGIGPVEVEVPRDRKGKFKTQIIARSKRYEEDLRQDLCLMFLTGVTTRSLSMISSRFIGRKLSPTEVSGANKELVDAVEKWRTRELSKESIKYLFIDGVCFSMRMDGSVEMVFCVGGHWGYREGREAGFGFTGRG